MEWIKKWKAAYPRLTDIHLTEGEAVAVRENGNLIKTEETAGKDLFEAFFRDLPDTKKEEYGKSGACDIAFGGADGRFRLHLYRCGNKDCAALRLLPPLSGMKADPDEAWLEEVAGLTRGLVIISGPSGSGKSTTLARLLQKIGGKRSCHIVTLEDPVEYILSSKRSLIHQREIGADAADFAQGVRDSLREDPDVIAVGEMRDGETMAAALTAAETGHLVLGTLHNGRATEAISRMIHGFPADRQSEVRSVLASVLRCVSTQRLWRRGTKTILLREILTNSPAISRLIRDGKEEQVVSYMETGAKHMRTLKQAAYHVKGVAAEERKELLKLVEEM